MSNHCTFCDLIQGAAEVSVCHEDADSIAFMDIQPVNAGHVLVVPRAHYNSLLDVPPEIGVHLFQVTMKLAGAIRRVTGCDDMNIVVNSGAAAGQDEPHYHVHIIPRRENDGFNIELPFNGSSMPKRTVLDAMAVQLISAMRDPMKSGITGGSSTGSGSSENTGSSGRAGSSGRTGSSADAGSSTASRSSAGAGAPADARRAEAPEASAARPPRRVAVPDREIVVRRAVEGVTTGRPDVRGTWRVEEGAHGELLYERREAI